MQKNIRPFGKQYPIIGSRVFIDPTAVVIGDVRLGDDVSVWPMAVIRGDVNNIIIGHGTNIQDGAILHVTHDGPFTAGGKNLVIAEQVTIGHRAMLHACEIFAHSLIGMGAIILDNAIIEEHVIIGAGSLVSPGKRLQKGYLYVGNPAKAVRPLTDTEINQLHYSAEHYIRLKNDYLR